MSERPRSGTSGDALAALCEEEDTVAFGVVSIHNQPLVDALDRAGRYVPVRHEATAVNAADGYARASGRLGVAVTSTGVGAGNAAGSLVEALTAGSGVLHVTGNIEAAHLGLGRGVIHETKNQLQMLDAVSKHATTALDAGSIGDELFAGAARAGRAPPGPVSIEIPIDLQYEATTWCRSAAEPVAPGRPRPEVIAAAARALASAERPVIWAGGGAVGARRPLDRLATSLGAAVLTSNAGRGVIPETDPRVVGNFAASDGGAELLAAADLVLSIGTHFRSNETRHYALALPELHLQIDIDPAAIGRVYPAAIGLCGEAGEILDLLLDRLGAEIGARPGDSTGPWAEQITDTRRRVRRELTERIGPYAELCRAMRATLPPPSPLVRDVTISASAWGNRLLDVLDPATNINARGGGIGQGLGMAIGAATARPDTPTSLMVGDGGLALHLGDLATAVQQELWLIALVFNDGGYGVLRNLQDHHFDRRSGVDLVTPSFDRLAEAFGLHHRRLADPADCDEVLGDAIDLHGPVLVEIDCGEFGEMTTPFVPPVPVRP